MQCACVLSPCVFRPALPHFTALSHERHAFQGGKIIEHKLCIFIFSDILIQRGIEQYTTNVISSHVKFPLPAGRTRKRICPSKIWNRLTDTYSLKILRSRRQWTDRSLVTWRIHTCNKAHNRCLYLKKVSVSTVTKLSTVWQRFRSICRGKCWLYLTFQSGKEMPPFLSQSHLCLLVRRRVTMLNDIASYRHVFLW